MAPQDERERGVPTASTDVDPLEERTQPMARPDSNASEEPTSEAADLETTTWSGAAAAPPLIEEEATPVPPPDPVPTPPTPPASAEAEETVVAEPEPEPEPVSAPAPAPAPESPVEPAESALPLEEVDSTETLLDLAPPEAAPSQPIAPSSSLHPLLLERIEPSLGRGERLRLDAAHWKVSLGRAETNEVRLYTASASREHAVIAGNEAGEWVLTPTEGKTVLIDGDETDEPVVLEVGMNLVLGSDHLRCVTEGLSRPEMGAQTAAEGLGSNAMGLGSRLRSLSLSTWLIIAIGLIGLGLIGFAWLSGG